MKNKIIKILWAGFAWGFGWLWIISGVEHIFGEKLPGYEKYNEIFGVFAILLGFTLIVSWLKQFRGRESRK